MLKRSLDHRYLQKVNRPVSGMAKDYPAGYVGYMHSHTRAQFLYAASGSMKVTFDIGCWIIPPQRAVWIPPGYSHQTGSIGALEMRTLYIQEDACPPGVPSSPRMISVSTVLRELVLRAMQMPIEYDEYGQDARILAALLGEINWTPLHPVSLPPLRDLRLRKMEEMLCQSPDDKSTLDIWAQRLEVSPGHWDAFFNGRRIFHFRRGAIRFVPSQLCR